MHVFLFVWSLDRVRNFGQLGKGSVVRSKRVGGGVVTKWFVLQLVVRSVVVVEV